MTTFGEARLWLEQFPLREPQLFEQEWNGILYPGEIIRSDIWSLDWAGPLSGDVYFRIVLLTQQPNSPTPEIAHKGIALFLPGSNVYRQRDQVVEELSTIRETQTLYLTQRDPESALIRRTLQRRQQGLEEELLTREVARYSSGTVITDSQIAPTPDGLFTGADPVSWFTNIARWLLSRTYAESPIHHQVLPRAVAQDDAGLLFEAVFPKERQPTQNALTVLSELGPGLGLSSSSGPGRFNPTACPALELIRSRVSAQTVAWSDLHHYLSHEVGLTGPLATLYLLVYVHQTRPELEVRLVEDHELLLSEGRPLNGNRLTGDLLRPLVWDSRISQWATTLGPITEPAWNDALPYLSVISAHVQPVSAGEGISQQEHHLLQDLASVHEKERRGQRFLDQLYAISTDSHLEGRDISGSLRRISSISGNDFLSVYDSIRNTYNDYRLLEDDLAQVNRLAQLAQFSGDIEGAWGYLAGAPVPTHLAELSVEKQALTAIITPSSLLTSSLPWAVLSRQVEDFKSSYAQAYRSHHRQFHLALNSYRLDLGSVKLKLKALELLNSLAELGPPTGRELPQLIEALETDRSVCTAPEDALDLGNGPQCPHCRLTLEEVLDVTGLSRAATLVEGTLGEKNRALSNLLVDKIIQGQIDQRLDDFLKIVQASDLSALSNTISEEMVSFIRRLLE